MSKIVKGTVRRLTKVVKGTISHVSKLVKGAVGAVKKFASSKIGKILIAAAAIYFGVPMLAGGLGGASAGFAAGQGFFGTIGSTLSGAFTGAGAGLSQAWGGLVGATTGGGGMTALSGGFSPSAAFSAGSSAATPLAGSGVLSSVTGQGAGLTAPGAPVGGGLNAASSAPGLGGSSGFQAINPTMAPSNYALTGAGGAAPTASMAGQTNLLAGNGLSYMAPAAAGGAAPGGAGFLAQMAASPYTAPALIQAGGQVVSAVGSGIAAKAEQERQERLAQEEEARRNYNIGTPLWNTQPAVQFGRG